MAENKDSVCLIVSPSPFLLDERNFMSLGILKVASVLEAKNFSVEMVDLSGIENYEEAMRAHTSNSEAKYFGITATTPQMPAARNIAQVIRRHRPDIKIILGGPHVTLTNAAYRKEKDSPKLIDADDQKSSLFLDNFRLNLLPYPARHLMDVESYHYTVEGQRALSLIAQLGCPFECGFCGGRASPFLRKIRMRSIENIVGEMKLMHQTYGVNGFMMYDDELNVNKQMIALMRAIADAQEDLGVEWRLRGFIKSELFTEEQAEVMFKAGFRQIFG